MKNSSKVGSEEHGKYLALIQQFKNLENEWKKSLEKSRPRNPRTSLKGSDSSVISSFDQLLQNSPRVLMSSLQNRKSPSDRVWRVKNCNMAVEEILRDRRAAIMSGKLKGRRLFRPAESPREEESDLNYGGGGGEICSDLFINHQSCSFSDSSLSEEKVVVEVEKMVAVEVANVAEKRGGDRRLRGGGGCMVVVMAWFGVVLILITLGLVSMSCNGIYVQENELILVPT